MAIILSLFAGILALALWQEEHGRDLTETSEKDCCK